MMKYALSLVVFGSLFLTGGDASAKSSSFQKSCSGIDLDITDQDVWIVADCGDGNGRFVNTRIELRGINNGHGFLNKKGNGASSFQRSCDDIYLEWNDFSVKLNARCDNGNGGVNQTFLYINNIENRFGTLRKTR